MEYNVRICDMAVGQTIEGFYVLSEAAAKTTAGGKPYLSAALCDRTGRIAAMAWDYAGPVSAADVGKAVKVRGEVSEYRGAPQLRITKLRLAGGGDRYDAAALVPSAPIDADAAMREVRALLAGMEDADYRRVAETLLERSADAFRRIPAAKSMHHAFLHGLLMHTANMLRIADFLSGLYGDVVDRSLLLAGTLLHDFQKREEFAFSELGLVTEYTLRGQLVGHLVMGAQEVAAACAELGVPEEKSALLQHLILSHHGTPEWGAAVLPTCAEAELLSCVDLIDSRMEIYRESFASTPPGAFSERIPALDGKRVYRPRREPAAPCDPTE